VKLGQQVNVRVLELDAANRRVSLSIKSAYVMPTPPAGATPEPAKKKKKIQLRGGLDY